MSKLSVFIVDDDKFLSDMYAIKFGQAGYDVVVAGSGMDALVKMTDGYEPDVMLLDIVMPQMDGFELLTEMKKRGVSKKTVIIILSNLGQKEDIDKGVKYGVDGYIVKASCTPSEVLVKTNEILEKKESGTKVVPAEVEKELEKKEVVEEEKQEKEQEKVG